ncbi:hypothetical protein AMELA_G00063520 [Ameiurus melas]|uniref:USP domain-containing protein n=1 Tax=Ameiurus melas TaxID=219545 RepID=A0A7J6B657_AMEME|nr:hypothetical protein AMELA_G00063520 [Ameiurus melas]
MEFSINHYYRNQEGMTSVEKRYTGKRYNGLKNQGATCYLNSVLQCLYMTEDFRKEVESFRADSPDSDKSSTDLRLELQKLFAKIKDDDGTTEGITRSLCISNVHEQQDAVEYYQRTLKEIGPQFSKVFEGKMSNITKCPNNHKFKEKCHFFTIPLPIETGHMDVFEVVKGLDTFFKQVKLDEDNWLYCEHCGKKTETETWNEIEEFPTILTLYPKRFYFDYTQMRLVKNNCGMNIPMQLQINDIGYELYAVINHSGGVGGGHYNADIKSFEDDEWYRFDDSSVTKDTEFCQKNSLCHSQLAYLLMYRKVDGLHPDEKSTSELQLQEYNKLVTNLLRWIRYYISEFEESKFPTSYKEIETIYHNFIDFKMIQLPINETDKNNSRHIYKGFKGSVQAGQIPPGYNPNDVEKEWSQLHEAITKWERLFRNKFERVYCFHERLVNMRMMSGNTVSVYRVPLTHSQLDEVMLYYIQDLLDWVKKNQRYIHNSEWGADLPSIESHLDSRQTPHQSMNDLKSNIHHAEADENFSVARQQNLTGLHGFAVDATNALIWLSERTEEEVKYDWSDDNTNMTAKKDNNTGLMRDLEQMKKKVNTIKATGDKLLKEGHPAQSTIEALTAALETQWRCLQEVCCCSETHLKKNTAYFQFFADVKEAEEKMKKIQQTMKKKYMCDHSTTVTDLEHLLQDIESHNEQLNVFKTHLESLKTRAKTIVQLKPRNPATPVKEKLPIQAITVHRGDMYVLLNNSQPHNWKVKSSNGSKATVPSICFIIPPINKEAEDSISGLAASWQELMILWQKLHADMTSLLSWQYLMRDIQYINSCNIMTQDCHNALQNMKQHHCIFMSNSQDSEFFGADERKQAESAYKNTKKHCKNLLQSAKQGEQDESLYKIYINQIKDLSLSLERCESHIVRCIRQSVDIEPRKSCAQEITEQKKVKTELMRIKKDIDAVVKQSKPALASSQQSTWSSILRTEIDIIQKKIDHFNSLSSDFMDKLQLEKNKEDTRRVKSIDLEIHSTQGTEDVLRNIELCYNHKVPANEKELVCNQSQPKKLCCEAEPDKPVEAEHQDDMQGNKCMPKTHSEGKGDYRMSCVANLKEVCQAVSAQAYLRLQEVNLLYSQMPAYIQNYNWLIQWIADTKQRQQKIQAKPDTEKAFKEQLAQGKKLFEEIKNNKDKVKECEDYAIAYMNAVKDHERQLVIYKPLVGPSSSIKLVFGSDRIKQEISTLKTQYDELWESCFEFKMDIHQYLENKQKANRTFNEEKRIKMAETEPGSHARANAKEVFAYEGEKQKQHIQQQLQELSDQGNLSDQEIKDKSQQEQEALKSRNKIEEGYYNRLRKVAQEETEKFREPVKEETKKKWKAEDELKQNSEAEQQTVKQRQKGTKEFEFKQKAEDAQAKKLAARAKECSEKKATQFQQNTDETENQKQEDEAEEAKCAKAQEQLRYKPETAENASGGLMGHEFYLPNDVVKQEKEFLVEGLRKKINLKELLYSQIIDQKTYTEVTEGLVLVEDLSKDLKKYLEGTSCIAGVIVEVTKERLSIYQAMMKNMITKDIAILLLEAQAATGYVIDPIKNLKLTVEEAVKMEVVGSEFKDQLLYAEKAVTGYVDQYGMVISLFQAMKKGLISKKRGVRLLEAQIATGGIIDPKASHRLPVKMACKRGLFDEEMSSILTDNSDDTKCFFDPNTEENLTYLQLLERCMTDPETRLFLLLLKEKKHERKTSSKPSVRKYRGVIVAQETGKEMSVYAPHCKDLTDHQKCMALVEQKCEREEITGTSKSMITDIRSGHHYDIGYAIARNSIDKSALDQYCAGTQLITKSAYVLSDNMSGFKSHSSSFASTSSYPMNPVPSIRTPAAWTEEMGPVAGILDTHTLEKLSVTEAMHRNLVDRITAQRLLEAQACTGGIIDPNTAEKFTVVDAINKGLIDKIMSDSMDVAQKAFQGVENPITKTKMSAAQALNQGWLHYETGQRFLEIQYLTGGLIEPGVPGRLSLDDAVKKDILDAHTAQKLQDVSGYAKYLICPKTKLKISYKDAMERSKVEEGSCLRLLEASSQY